MKYTAKWVEKNLGITKKMIRIYEAGGALPKNMGRNPINNYREYSEEDLLRLWSVKLLRDFDYSVDEIAEIVRNPNSDFYEVISRKLPEIENKYEKAKMNLEFAKTIKLTGSVPIPEKMGSITYKEFIERAKKHWNFYLDDKGKLMADVVDRIASKTIYEWTLDDFKSLEYLTTFLGEEEKKHQYNINAYYRLLIELKHLGHTNEAVQTVVKLLYEYQLNNIADEEGRKRMTPCLYAKRAASLFIDGDMAKAQEQFWGKEACSFIAKAIAYFGGFENIDDL